LMGNGISSSGSSEEKKRNGVDVWNLKNRARNVPSASESSKRKISGEEIVESEKKDRRDHGGRPSRQEKEFVESRAKRGGKTKKES